MTGGISSSGGASIPSGSVPRSDADNMEDAGSIAEGKKLTDKASLAESSALEHIGEEGTAAVDTKKRKRAEESRQERVGEKRADEAAAKREESSLKKAGEELKASKKSSGQALLNEASAKKPRLESYRAAAAAVASPGREAGGFIQSGGQVGQSGNLAEARQDIQLTKEGADELVKALGLEPNRTIVRPSNEDDFNLFMDVDEMGNQAVASSSEYGDETALGKETNQAAEGGEGSTASTSGPSNAATNSYMGGRAVNVALVYMTLDLIDNAKYQKTIDNEVSTNMKQTLVELNKQAKEMAFEAAKEHFKSTVINATMSVSGQAMQTGFSWGGVGVTVKNPEKNQMVAQALGQTGALADAAAKGGGQVIAGTHEKRSEQLKAMAQYLSSVMQQIQSSYSQVEQDQEKQSQLIESLLQNLEKCTQGLAPSR